MGTAAKIAALQFSGKDGRDGLPPASIATRDGRNASRRRCGQGGTRKRRFT